MDQNNTTKQNTDFETNQHDLEPSASSIAKNAQAEPIIGKKQPPHKRVWHWTKNLTKKQKIILIVAVIILVAAACFGALWALNNQSKPLSQANSPSSEPVQSKLTGLEVEPEVNERQVTAVMIENSPDARPQAGLIDAGIVYEAVSEGGITRFVTLFQDTESDYLGPVRSIRPYYLDWLVPYDAAIGHVGGSPQALAQIKAQNVKDLDQFANPSAYDRVNNRFAPHNVYTSTKRLDQIEKSRGYKKSIYEGLERDRKERPLDIPKVKNIQLDYSSPLYNVSFSYNKSSNNYKRVMGGEAHKDEKSGKQISPKVVVVLEIQRTQDGVYSVYRTVGSGKARVYQNGEVITGKWQKKNRKSQFVLTDKEGEAIKLAPGKTWVSIVEPGKVSHKK